MMWTVIYSNIANGWSVIQMTSSHDAHRALEAAKSRLLGMWGPDENCHIVALVKGSHDVYQPDVKGYL